MAQRVYKLGKAVTDTTTDIKQLYNSGTLGTGNYQTFFDASTAAAYQVTAAKTFLLGALQLSISGANVVTEIGYGDTAVNNSATPPTNSKVICRLNLATASTTQLIELLLTVPATKYPYYAAISGTNPIISVQGVEV